VNGLDFYTFLMHFLPPPLSPNRKKALNRLFVEDNVEDENSVIFLHPSRMEQLSLFRGDTVRVKGKRRKVFLLSLS
jgi:formylmethanofuran dehydrogenase subunit D